MTDSNHDELAEEAAATRARRCASVLFWFQTVAFLLLALWTAAVCWGMRSMAIGLNGTLALVICTGFHAPFLLLAAPQLNWRPKWLIMPAASLVALVVLALFAVGGLNGSPSLEENASAVTRGLTEMELAERNLLLTVGFIALTGLLLACLQEQSTRFLVGFGLIGFLALTETVFRVEEAMIQTRIDDAIAFVSDHEGPWDDTLREAVHERFGGLQLLGTGGTIHFRFARPLDKSRGVTYASGSRTYDVED